MRFFLDPYILAVPNASASRQRRSDYIKTLHVWYSEVTKTHHQFRLANPIVDALLSAEQYPYITTLRTIPADVWEELRITPVDFARAYQPFLTPPFIEDELSDDAICAVEAATTVIIPDDIARRLHPDVATGLRESLAQAGYAKQHCDHPFARDMVFATCEMTSDTVAVQAEALGVRAPDPVKVETEWPAITSPDQVTEYENLPSFWEDTPLALDWAYRHLCGCGILNPTLHKLPPVQALPSFNNSIRRLHLDQQSDTLVALFKAAARALSAVDPHRLPKEERQKAELEGQWPRGGYYHHELWITRDSEVQRVRPSDHATAWRIFVRRGNPSIRLHYWLIPDGRVDLSLVCTHDTFDID